jgi:hypothetical protein
VKINTLKEVSSLSEQKFLLPTFAQDQLSHNSQLLQESSTNEKRGDAIVICSDCQSRQLKDSQSSYLRVSELTNRFLQRD